MFWAFIKKCRFPDGKRDFYAHVVLEDGLEKARRKVESSFAARNVWGEELKKKFPNAVLEGIIDFGNSEESQKLYDKACQKASELSKKPENQEKANISAFD